MSLEVPLDVVTSSFIVRSDAPPAVDADVNRMVAFRKRQRIRNRLAASRPVSAGIRVFQTGLGEGDHVDIAAVFADSRERSPCVFVPF